MPDPSRYLTGHEHSRLYIGKLAEITGASRKAIRLYEAQGLLPRPERRGSYRVYTQQHIFLVHVIKHTQSYGFSLAELRALIKAIAGNSRFPVADAIETVEKKRAAVRREAQALRVLDRRLRGLITDIKRHFG